MKYETGISVLSSQENVTDKMSIWAVAANPSEAKIKLAAIERTSVILEIFLL